MIARRTKSRRRKSHDPFETTDLGRFAPIMEQWRTRGEGREDGNSCDGKAFEQQRREKWVGRSEEKEARRIKSGSRR